MTKTTREDVFNVIDRLDRGEAEKLLIHHDELLYRIQRVSERLVHAAVKEGEDPPEWATLIITHQDSERYATRDDYGYLVGFIESEGSLSSIPYEEEDWEIRELNETPTAKI